jgi:hypothetical protein
MSERSDRENCHVPSQGHVTTYQYNAKGLLVGIVRPQGEERLAPSPSERGEKDKEEE